MSEETKTNSGNEHITFAVCGIVFVGLLVVAFPHVNKSFKRARATSVMSGSKDIYVSLRDYAFNNNGIMIAEQADANAVYQVLFDELMISDESPFYTKSAHLIDSERVEDGRLAAGENIYSYWVSANGDVLDIDSTDANAPLMSAPNLVNHPFPAYGDEVYDFSSYGGWL